MNKAMKWMTVAVSAVLAAGCFAGCEQTKHDGPEGDSGLYDYGDEYFRSIEDRVILDVDSPDYLYNDFSDGIDERFSLVTAIWGNEGSIKHQGLQAGNVFLTTDGDLAIRSTGDYYRGEGVGNTNGIRTGGGLVTDHDMGPGRFEIRMKVAPRSGVCSAFWTYQYDSADPSVNGWNEIDIEIVGGGANTFDSIMYTTWQSAERANTATPMLEDVRLSDNEYHIHTFDWYTDYMGTGKPRIDWFLDGNLIYSTDKSVALKSGNLWIGAWRTSDFAGISAFDTTWTLVDWVRYTPFLGQEGWIETNYRSEFNSYDKNFPTERIEMTDEMLNQRLANTGFEIVDTAETVPQEPFVEDYASFAAVGWKKSTIRDDESDGTIVKDAHSGSNALRVTKGAVDQEIEGAFEGFTYDLAFWAKKAGSENGELLIRYYDKNGIIPFWEEAIDITSDEYAEYTKTITAPKNCAKIMISLRSGIFDDMTCLYKGQS